LGPLVHIAVIALAHQSRDDFISDNRDIREEFILYLGHHHRLSRPRTQREYLID